MNKAVGPDTPGDPRLDEVFAGFLGAAAAGRPDAEAWVAGHPEHAAALRAFAENVAWMRRLAGPPLTSEGATPAGASDADAATVDHAAEVSTIDVGRYVRWSPHAQGGLGEVFTAIDTELHRVVALKRLQDRHAEDAPCRRHFLLEAEVTARLDHPGVVPVYSLFRDGSDRPCYTMRFIEGQTLDDALRAYHAGPPDPVAFRRLLQSFIQACETLAYAHSRGVIHRDIKPQNIMLGKFGETVVVDWGLAKVVGRTGDEASRTALDGTLHLVGDSSLDRTAMGAAVGTIPYMSPEQAAGRWDVIDAASDVYGLGGVLYALLTGQAPPLEGRNWPEVQQKIQRGDFPRPGAVKAGVPRALEAICLKAMAMKPEGRYPSALALAADVERWLADEPVGAHREPLVGRLRRWARRHRVLVASGTIGFAVLVASAWVISIERAKTAAEERLKLTHLASSARNSRVITSLVARQTELQESARAALDGLASQVGHDPRLSGRELQPLRRSLLRKVIAFWDDAIQIDTNAVQVAGGHTPFFRRQRILGLARLGEHTQADTEAKNLWAGLRVSEKSREAAYDLARAYSLCAGVVQDDYYLGK